MHVGRGFHARVIVAKPLEPPQFPSDRIFPG
jgi:hypothetical protein